MILTELRGYEIAEDELLAFLFILQTNQIHHWKELEETIPTIPNTQYCQKNELRASAGTQATLCSTLT